MGKRFSDFAQEAAPLDGAKMKIDSVINKPIMVMGAKVTGSKYTASGSTQCLTLQFELEGRKYILFTGSTVLIEQATKYLAEMPFEAIIKKIDKYYTFS